MTEPNHYAHLLKEGVEAILAESSLRAQVVSEVKHCRAQGQALDAKAFLAEHPELSTRKSIVLDLAYEEFCQRTEGGEPIDPDTYCRRFSTFERSVRRMIAVHEFLDENPDLIPAAEIDWPKPGQTFQGFFLLAELGQGAFAKAFLAREPALGDRLVAVKVSRDGGTEAEILGKLRHPNIVPVYSAGEDAETGLSVVCMPYLGRVTLCDLLDRLFAEERKPSKARAILEALRADADESPATDRDAHPWDPKLRSGSFIDGAVHLGCQLADALAYSHSEEICHSDLKPSNVLITPGGRPMLLDFNLAFDPQAVARRLGGTLPYMAPEQLRAIGRPSPDERPAVSERSDIFSLGVILYELLSGSLPFGPVPANREHEEIRALLLKRQESGPRSLREVNGEVDRSLAGLVERCLAADPEARPQTAAAVAAALRSSRSPARRARRWMRQHGWLVRSVAASLLLICVGVGYHLSTRDPYAVRQLNAGVRYYRQNEYAKAEIRFSEAMESPEERGDALFFRGRTRQKQGRILLALEDYEQAAELCPAPEIDACRAYCLALEGQYRDGVNYSSKAIDAGFATAAVYNNLGYCHLREGRVEQAMLAFDEALRQDESLRPALYNRALTELRWARTTRRAVDSQAGRDIDKAIAAGPPIAEMYLDAARIYSRLEVEPGQHRERIRAYLRDALQYGLNPDLVLREFKSLFDEPALQGLLADAAPGVKRTSAIRLADPLADDSFQVSARFAQRR